MIKINLLKSLPKSKRKIKKRLSKKTKKKLKFQENMILIILMVQGIMDMEDIIMMEGGFL